VVEDPLKFWMSNELTTLVESGPSGLSSVFEIDPETHMVLKWTSSARYAPF